MLELATEAIDGGILTLDEPMLRFGFMALALARQKDAIHMREPDLRGDPATQVDEVTISVLSRDRILDEVWGEGAYPSARTIDTFIYRLRQKLETDPTEPAHLLTVHGVGYRYVPVPQNREPSESFDNLSRTR